MQVSLMDVSNGATTTCPVWENHKRGKNWWAAITPDPRAPNGLNRRFAEKARGNYFYIVPPWLERGTPFEFGADYYSAVGRKSPCRKYGVILGTTLNEFGEITAIHWLEVDSPEIAFTLAKDPEALNIAVEKDIEEVVDK